MGPAPVALVTAELDKMAPGRSSEKCTQTVIGN